MRELNFGEKVYIREDLEDDCRYGMYNWVKCMLTGWQEVRCVKINGVFNLVKDGIHCYTPEMVDWEITEAYHNLKPGDNVYIREDLTHHETYGSNVFIKEMHTGLQKILMINEYSFQIEADGYFYTPEMIDWDKTLNRFEIKLTFPSLEKEKNKIVPKEIDLEYDGDFLTGKIDDRRVIVARAENDKEDLEKAVMMALIKTLGFNYQDVKNILEKVKINKQTKTDNVNSPNHYQLEGLGIEVIDIMRSNLESEGFKNYCKGNVIKYILRAEKKNGLEDYKKAQKYLSWIIEAAENDNK